MERPVGCFHQLVAKPKRNDGAVDTLPEQLHRRSVAKRMGRNPFLLQRGAFFPRRNKMVSEDISKSVMAQ